MPKHIVFKEFECIDAQSSNFSMYYKILLYYFLKVALLQQGYRRWLIPWFKDYHVSFSIHNLQSINHSEKEKYEALPGMISVQITFWIPVLFCLKSLFFHSANVFCTQNTLKGTFDT